MPQKLLHFEIIDWEQTFLRSIGLSFKFQNSSLIVNPEILGSCFWINFKMRYMLITLSLLSDNQSCWNFWWYCYWLLVSYQMLVQHHFFASLFHSLDPHHSNLRIFLIFPYSICYSYVECTSAAIQALASFRKLYPGHRQEEIERCIEKAAAFIEQIQASDGSWLASPFLKTTFSRLLLIWYMKFKIFLFMYLCISSLLFSFFWLLLLLHEWNFLV